MNKTLFSLAVVLGLSYAPLQADSYSQDYTQLDCCPDTCGWGTFNFGADWLYWKTEETGLNYGTNSTLNIDDSEFTTRFLKPTFKYDSGYRLFADYLTLDSQWKFCAAYTHVPSKASNSFASTGINNFGQLLSSNFPLFSGIFQENSYSALSSNWNSSINYFDFDISRSFTLCSNFDIIPHIGLRVLWMNQKMRIDGTATLEEGSLDLTSQFRNKFTGVGLGAGLAGAWRIFDGLSLVGNVGGTVLYSHFHNRGRLTASASGTPNVLSLTYKDSSDRGIPTFDSFIGLQYAYCLYGYSTQFHVGWEQHIIYQTNDYSFNSNGSTTMQGLTLGAAVSF